MKPEIVVIGSCNIDLQCFTQRLPKPGETLHGTQFMKGFGGKGANQCVAAAKLGANTAMIARLGDDSFGKDFLLDLKSKNVNTDFVQITEGKTTGMAQITVAENGENTIVIVVGANNDLSPTDMKTASEIIMQARVLVFQFETPLETTVEALKIKSNGNGIAIINAAPAINGFDSQIYTLSDIFLVNEIEAEILTGFPVQSIDEANVAVRKLLEYGCKTVIITMGASGAVFASHLDNIPIHVPVTKVKPVDTTGAGDMFTGSLAYYLAYHPNLPFKEMVRRSCELAAVSVLKYGTQSSYPKKDEVSPDLFS